MHKYEKAFDILKAHKEKSSTLYEKHKVAINIVLAMLDNSQQNSFERLELLSDNLGGKEAVIISATEFQGQLNAFSNFGFICQKPEISKHAKNKLIEMASDVYHIASQLSMDNPHESNAFFEHINKRLNNCLEKIFLE